MIRGLVQQIQQLAAISQQKQDSAPWHIISTVIWRSERTKSHASGLNASLCPVTPHIWTRNDGIWRNHSKPLFLWDKFLLSLDKCLKSLSMEIVDISTDCTVTPIWSVRQISEIGVYATFVQKLSLTYYTPN
jgi:hypothetical protein